MRKIRFGFTGLLLVLASLPSFAQDRAQRIKTWNARAAQATPAQWAERAATLAEWMREDPAAAMAAALPPATVEQLRRQRPDAAPFLEQWGEWQGEAERLVHDDFATGASRRILRMHQPDGSSDINLTGPAPELACGDQIRVTGLRLAGSIAGTLNAVTPGRATSGCQTIGEQRVAIILLNFAGNPLPNTVSAATLQSALTGASNSVDGYWREASYGKASATGSVFGPFNIAQNYGCNDTEAIRTAAIAAADGALDFTAFTRIVIVFPGACGGLGSIGCRNNSSPTRGAFTASISWIGSDDATPGPLVTAALIHELGHNLGLEHASSLAFGAEPLGGLGTAGTHDEYGDRFSLMGLLFDLNGSYLMGHYAALHKRFLGWFADGNISQVESTGSYTLAPYETLTSAPQVLRIRRGNGNDRWLWVEYRQPTGYDASLAPYSTQLFTGAVIHYENPAETTYNNYTRLLNFRAPTVSTFRQPALAAGQSWQDPYTELTLQAVSATGSGLTIQVNYDTPCATLTPSSATHTAAATTGSVTVTAPGSCTWAVLSNNPWITVTSAATGTGNGTVNYSITANSTSSARSGAISIARQTFNITQSSTNNPPTPTSVTPASGAVPTGTDQTFTAVFTDLDGANTFDTVGLWITPNSEKTNACFLEYRRASDQLRLYNDSPSSWTYTSPGSFTTMSNSQCQVDVGSSSATVAGNTLTLQLSLRFFAAFNGARNIIGAATDTAGGANGGVLLGNITIGAGSTVALTFNTVPAGLPLVLGGTTYATPKVVNVATGSTINVEAAITQPLATGSRANFANWSDSGARTHTITAGSSAASYTANYSTQFLLTRTVLPAGGGTLTASPAANDGFYDQGASVQLTAAAGSGTSFYAFTGALTGATNPQSVTMSAPRAVTANFVCAYQLPVSAASAPYIAGSGAFDVTTASGCTFTPTTAAGWLTLGVNGSSVTYAFAANPAAAVRTATITVGGQTFTLTQAAGPATGSAVIATPTPGSVLTGTSATFTWAAATGADGYWLDVGTEPGSGNVCASGQITALTYTCTPLPTKPGANVYVQLHTHLNGIWLPANRYVYTTPAATVAAITAPAAGTQLAATANFTWSAATGAEAYWFDLGNRVGEGNVCSSGLLPASTLTFTCNNLPATGIPLYAQLWTRIGGNWMAPNRVTYQAPGTGSTGTPVAATLTTPAGGSVVSGTSATFGWTTGTGIDYYWLDAGTGPGRGNIFGGTVTTTTKTVTGLPNNGQPLYIRLWSHAAGGTWLAPIDYTFATLSDPRAVLQSPTAAVFPGTTVTFTWSAGTNADGYWLDIGPAPGIGAWSSGFQTATTRTVTGLPCTGAPAYVRLWTRIGGVYQTPIDYPFTLASGCAADPRATLLTPATGTLVTGTSATFTWNAGGTGTQQYWLDVGSAPGLGNIASGAQTTLTRTVTNLPNNGQPLYVRLWTNVNGTWQTPYDYTFQTAADPRATLASPQPGTRLTGTAATFTWNPGATGTDAYWLDVGTAFGLGNLSSGLTTSTSATVTNLPNNNGATTIYVRLWTRVNGVWRTPIDYTYTN